MRSDLPHRGACLSLPLSHAGNTGMSPGRLKAWHSWYGPLKMDGVGTSDCCARGFGGEGTGGGVTLWVLFGRDSFKIWEFHWKFRGEKDVTSCHLNGILNSKHIFWPNICQASFFWAHTKLPSKEKWNLSTSLYIEKKFWKNGVILGAREVQKRWYLQDQPCF